MSALALNTVYSARDTAITQRPTSTALLCIDSEDRFKDYPTARAAVTALSPNASPYNFTINKSESLMNGFFTRVSVTEVVFPWVIPNINQYTSLLTVDYTVGGVGGVAAVIMAHGFYTPSQIASEIQRQIRLIPGLGAFTMTYGIDSIGFPAMPPTQRPIFEYKTNAVGVTIGFTADADDPLRKDLFDILGFNDDNQTESAEGNGNDTYCQTTRYIDIVCTQLTANQSLKDTMSQPVARDVLCRVYVGDAQGVQSTTLPSSSTFCPPGCMPTTIYREFSQPKQIQWIPNQPVPGYLKFQVFDDAGFELSDYVFEARGNGANWSMTLLVTEN